MKTIIILLLFVFLASCGAINNEKNIEENIKNDIGENEFSTKKLEDIKENNKIEKEEKISFDEVKSNLEKLKDLDSDELKELNYFVKDFYDRDILNKAKKSGNILKCEKLENISSINNCKKNIIILKGNEKMCDELYSTGSIISCKNKIFIEKAQSNLNENICDNIEDNTEEKFEINFCKNRIFEQKAIKNLDSNICKKINDKIQVEMCIKIVQMEKEIQN